MTIEVDEDRMVELECKCRALGDLFGGMDWLEKNGMHEDTPLGLRWIMFDIAREIEATREGKTE